MVPMLSKLSNKNKSEISDDNNYIFNTVHFEFMLSSYYV